MRRGDDLANHVALIRARQDLIVFVEESSGSTNRASEGYEFQPYQGNIEPILTVGRFSDACTKRDHAMACMVVVVVRVGWSALDGCRTDVAAGWEIVGIG